MHSFVKINYENCNEAVFFCNSVWQFIKFCIYILNNYDISNWFCGKRRLVNYNKNLVFVDLPVNSFERENSRVNLKLAPKPNFESKVPKPLMSLTSMQSFPLWKFLKLTCITVVVFYNFWYESAASSPQVKKGFSEPFIKPRWHISLSTNPVFT